MPSSIIWMHADAPDKPAVGECCNGCGVCCASAPCPVGMLVSRGRVGRCAMLTWQPALRRYRCGLVPALDEGARRPPPMRRLRSWLMRRWIGAGSGCDSYTAVGHL